MSEILQIPRPTWFVGCGNMGSAIVDGWRIAGLDLGPITVIRPSGKPVEGVRTVASLDEAGPSPEVAVLAFKPQKLDEIAPGLRPLLAPDSVLVSILAGVEVASLRERFHEVRGIIRAMPNLPVAIRRGVTGLYGEGVDSHAERRVGHLFAALGWAMWTADEAKLAAIGAVAGAGPAYVARFIAALATAGERRGLSPETAATVALETVLGTAWMAATTGESMDAVAKRVASPNGTTEAGLKLLDHDHVLDELIALAIDAAARRGAELAEEAKATSLEEPARLS
jgi:pyrroline-5-carboxylate reductase